MIKSYKPNRQAIIVRNPNFKPTPNVPTANPDKMTVKIVADDSAALQQVINGQANWDFHPIPVDRLAEVQQKYGDQLKIYTPANTYYYFMNNRTPPFDKLAVRQAVNYAIDRNALVRLYGGLATPTENVLPPTYPQYKKHSIYTYNLAKAKALIKSAGAQGAAVTDLGIQPRDLAEARRVPPGRPEEDRPQAEAEDHRRLDLLVDDRQPGEQGADRLRGLVPGLPAPARLVRRSAERRTGSRRRTTTTTRTSTTRPINTKIDQLKQKPTLNSRDQRTVGSTRQAGHPAGGVGAVREPAVHGLLLEGHGHCLATSTTCSTSSISARSA